MGKEGRKMQEVKDGGPENFARVEEAKEGASYYR